jgi:hypothetical protein
MFSTRAARTHDPATPAVAGILMMRVRPVPAAVMCVHIVPDGASSSHSEKRSQLMCRWVRLSVKRHMRNRSRSSMRQLRIRSSTCAVIASCAQVHSLGR